MPLRVRVKNVYLVPCSKCGIPQPETEYYRNGDRLRPDCITCVKGRRKKHYAENSEEIKARNVAWAKANPDAARAIKRRYVQNHLDEHTARNCQWRVANPDKQRACELAVRERQKATGYSPQRAWYQKNRRRTDDYHNAWRRARPDRVMVWKQRRRARKLAAPGSFTVGEWQTLKAHYDYRCLCCDRVEPDIKLTPDHVVPLARGGTNFIENIQPLCLSCNCAKQDKSKDYRPD